MGRTLFGALALAALMALTAPVAGAPSPSANCSFAPAIASATYAQMPAAIRRAIGPMAERDGAFQVTDVVIPGPSNPGRRVIRAGHRGDTWFVWYEAGGVAYSWHAAVFRAPASAAKPEVLLNAIVPVSWKNGAWMPQVDVCALIDAALSGRTPPANAQSVTYF